MTPPLNKTKPLFKHTYFHLYEAINKTLLKIPLYICNICYTPAISMIQSHLTLKNSKNKYHWRLTYGSICDYTFFIYACYLFRWPGVRDMVRSHSH